MFPFSVLEVISLYVGHSNPVELMALNQSINSLSLSHTYTLLFNTRTHDRLGPPAGKRWYACGRSPHIRPNLVQQPI
jgi:hypothetical protein